MRRTALSVSLWTLVGAALLACGCAPHRAGHAAHEADADAGVAPAALTVEILPRTPHLPTYPCGEQCHDLRTPDPTPRALTVFHARREVHHGPAIHWCGDCHDIAHPDHLTSLDGQTAISFDASDELCAQCHGERHRDWELGLHGLTTGGWRDHAQRRLCTACHDPHAQPERIHLEALPRPLPDPRIGEDGEP
jgi:hypothetical protein